MTSKRLRASECSAALIIMSLLWGCRSDPYETVPVTGKVTCEGKPAWGGTIIFRPIDAGGQTGRPSGSPGRSASALVAEDGSFRLTVPAAGGANDAVGTVVGPHRVSFVLPASKPRELTAEERSLPPEELEELKAALADLAAYPELPCGATISPAEVDVKPGENVFEFTLGAK